MEGFVGVILLTPILPEGEKLLDIAVRIGLAVVVGFLVQRLLFLVVGRVETWVQRAGKGGAAARQRSDTLGQILRNLCTVVVSGAVVVYALGLMGLNVGPILAGAGILGVALGFGAQSLVRDVIAGVFILAEDQFGVGDVIEVNSRPATVEGLTVRATTLRDFNGYLHFVPNGEMRIVVNRSRGWGRLAVDVPVAADQDIERALEASAEVARAMSTDESWRARLLGPIEVWGVEALGGSEVQIRLVVRAQPGLSAQEAARELRRRIVRAFAAAGVQAPPPHGMRNPPAAAASAAPRPADAN